MLIGRSDGAMVLCKLPVLRRPANLDGGRPVAYSLVVDAGGGCLDFLSLVYLF